MASLSAFLAATGRRIKELRRARGQSQEKLAHEAGISRTYMGMIELGAKQPSLATLLGIAEALGVTPAEVLLPPGADPARGREIVARIEAKLLSKELAVQELKQIENIVDGFLRGKEERPPVGEPFRRLGPREARPYANCLPLYSLKAAAGAFGAAQDVEPEVEPEAWVEVHGRTRPAKGLFVAQVVGESMNRRIPSGAYGIFRWPVTGSRQGRVVLVQHHDIRDPDHGGSYTVKVYQSEKAADEKGSWRHTRIVLKPDSSAAGYRPIVVDERQAGELKVVAELVEVLG